MLISLWIFDEMHEWRQFVAFDGFSEEKISAVLLCFYRSTTGYTDTKKKRPLYIYVCLFQTNAAILFSYFASIT